MPTLIAHKRWDLPVPNPQLQAQISSLLHIHPILVQLLINRGIATPLEAEAFLNISLDQLHDPFLMRDMDKAVERVKLARDRQERVLIFGDYDVDGVTSSVVLNRALTRYGLEVVHHIPDRMDDGYGLNLNVAELARQEQAKLVIAVDCGITALKEVQSLNAEGIDIVILDHHEPAEEGIPQCCAVVDPKRKDCPYPFKHLAAVGIAAKFTQALFGGVPKEILDLVALGTIADVVPLREENRIFVKFGLPCIENTDNLGLQALLDVARIKGKKMRPYHAGFILGPRINAAGRMESARHSLELLLSHDFQAAMDLALKLESINIERQQLQKTMIQEAMDMVEREVNFNKEKVIVLIKEGWHKGVLGIVASKIVETFYRPAIVATLENGIGTGSARSIDGFHLHDALNSCSDILDDFGGHRLAAGVTFRQEQGPELRRRLNEYAQKFLTPEDLVPVLLVDAEVSLKDLSVDLVERIDLLEPYGEGNRPPVFCTRNVSIKSHPMCLAKETLKFWISDGETTISVVGFGMGRFKEQLALNQTIDVAYELAIDDWNKAPTVQLRLRDIRLVSS